MTDRPRLSIPPGERVNWPGPDSARPIAALWARFEALLPPTVTDRSGELAKCRMFFYAGAADLYDWISESMDAAPPGLEVRLTMELFERVEAEIEVFRADPQSDQRPQ